MHEALNERAESLSSMKWIFSEVEKPRTSGGHKDSQFFFVRAPPGAILHSKPTDPGYYSNLFTVPKKDGGSHLVINLKALNSHLSIPHFKIGATGCVPMLKDTCKYLKFCWEGNVFDTIPDHSGGHPLAGGHPLDNSCQCSQTRQWSSWVF